MLHGIPFSVKEHLGLKGLRLHSGYAAFWDKIAQEDALVIQILVRAGAIPFARTTEPQSMLSLETDSSFYGVTTNAFTPRLSAGGSSGGEVCKHL
jgi:amidase